MIHHLKMTVLVDNTAEHPLLCEWGLSILIEADGTKILLDTGSSDMFAKNAEQLGIHLSDVNLGVLSHAHDDHSDGMDAFFSLNKTAPFLVREGSRENCFGQKEGAMEYIGIKKGFLREFRDRIRYVSGIHEISDGIWLIPHRKAVPKDPEGRTAVICLPKKGEGEVSPLLLLYHFSVCIRELTSAGIVASKSTPYQGFSGFFRVSAIVSAV